MGIFKERLKLSRRTLWHSASLVIFAVHVIAAISIFFEMSSLLVRYSTGEIIAGIAYTLSFAVIDWVGMTVFLVGVNLLLSLIFGQDGFVLRLGWLLVLSICIALLVMGSMLATWYVYLGFTGILVGGGWFLLRSEKLRKFALDFIDNLGLLAGMFVVLDVTSIAVVIFRNLSR